LSCSGPSATTLLFWGKIVILEKTCSILLGQDFFNSKKLVDRRVFIVPTFLQPPVYLRTFIFALSPFLFLKTKILLQFFVLTDCHDCELPHLLAPSSPNKPRSPTSPWSLTIKFFDYFLAAG